MKLTPLLVLIEDNCQMTEPLANARRPSLRARRKSLPHARLVHLHAFDVKSVDIDALSVFRVRQCRAHRLCHEPGGALRYELKDIKSVFNSSAANLIDN